MHEFCVKGQQGRCVLTARLHQWEKWSGDNRGFPTRIVYLYYISCLRYTILVGIPRNYTTLPKDRVVPKSFQGTHDFMSHCRLYPFQDGEELFYFTGLYTDISLLKSAVSPHTFWEKKTPKNCWTCLSFPLSNYMVRGDTTLVYEGSKIVRSVHDASCTGFVWKGNRAGVFSRQRCTHRKSGAGWYPKLHCSAKRQYCTEKFARNAGHNETLQTVPFSRRWGAFLFDGIMYRHFIIKIHCITSYTLREKTNCVWDVLATAVWSSDFPIGCDDKHVETKLGQITSRKMFTN